MKTEKININDIVINTVRNLRSSFIEVQFRQNSIMLKASMRCPRSIEAEKETQIKILTYLGFDNDQIEELNYE